MRITSKEFLALTLSITLASCTTNDAPFAMSPKGEAKITQTVSGKLFVEQAEIPAFAKNLDPQSKLVIDELKKLNVDNGLKKVALWREQGTTTTLDADTMTALVQFFDSESIEFEGPKSFQDKKPIGPFSFPLTH